jgi:hypothetical protein
VAAWTGLIWLKIGTGGGHLWMRLWTFGFHKMWGISWVAEELVASQEGLCSLELISRGPFASESNVASWRPMLYKLLLLMGLQQLLAHTYSKHIPENSINFTSVTRWWSMIGSFLHETVSPRSASRF